MSKRKPVQEPLWIAKSDLPTGPGHPFCAKLNAVLDEAGFNAFVETECQQYYALVMGRPSMMPGRFFRALLIGYFEGLESEREIAWRIADSLTLRGFLGLGLDEAAPHHSTISKTRRLIASETNQAVFTWIQKQLVAADLLTGKTIGIDATTLEANAAMRSIVRRDTGEGYIDFLKRLAKESGIKTPTRAALARFDRQRKKKTTSNAEWKHPDDPDAQVSKMKDGSTHLAHKAEHAVDLDTGAIVAVTLHGGSEGDTITLGETLDAAIEQVEAAQEGMEKSVAIQEVVADKGYHSNQTMIDLQVAGIRSYVSQPDRGRRDWSAAPDAQAPVYANRRRTRGVRGQALRRARGELVDRTFAHLYETGGIRRTYLRKHDNILKRLLIHAGAFNLGLLMRKLTGIGKPRVLQGALSAAFLLLCSAWRAISALVVANTTQALRALLSQYAYQGSQRRALSTGC